MSEFQNCCRLYLWVIVPLQNLSLYLMAISMQICIFGIPILIDFRRYIGSMQICVSRMLRESGMYLEHSALPYLIGYRNFFCGTSNSKPSYSSSCYYSFYAYSVLDFYKGYTHLMLQMEPQRQIRH